LDVKRFFFSKMAGPFQTEIKWALVLQSPFPEPLRLIYGTAEVV